MASEKYDPIKYQEEKRKIFQGETDSELVNSFNSQVGDGSWVHARSIYLHELRTEFQRRAWDFTVITNEYGGFNLAAGNQVYLKEGKLFLVREYIQEELGDELVRGEIILRTRLQITVRILAPFIFWKNSIGIPNQAIATTRHFWGKDGDRTVRENARELLIKSYQKIKIIDENIDIFAAQYDCLQKELKEVDKLEESETKEQIKRSLWRDFHGNLFNVYGLHISIYDKAQLEQIILAYKTDKRKIYLNQ